MKVMFRFNLDNINGSYIGKLVATTNPNANKLKSTVRCYPPVGLVWDLTLIRTVSLWETFLKWNRTPYRILRRLSDVIYEFENYDLVDSIKYRNTIHVLRMKPYRNHSRSDTELNPTTTMLN